MDLAAWNDRYKLEASGPGDPARLLVDAVEDLPPGAALDLACGSGRNALWLARRGWRVTAVDGAPAAISALRSRADGLTVDARVADLEKGEYAVAPDSWDLILMSYYLQRELFPSAKLGVKTGGLLVAIVHLAGPGQPPTATTAAPGELRTVFTDWEILRYLEGPASDPAHARPVAEIVAKRT